MNNSLHYPLWGPFENHTSITGQLLCQVAKMAGAKHRGRAARPDLQISTACLGTQGLMHELPTAECALSATCESYLDG